MAERIEPALTAEEWAQREAQWVAASAPGIVTVWGDNDEYGLTRVYMREANRIPALIALANAALPDDDPRKITREKVRLIRIALEDGLENTGEVDAGAQLRVFADALESYLPPERA